MQKMKVPMSIALIGFMTFLFFFRPMATGDASSLQGFGRLPVYAQTNAISHNAGSVQIHSENTEFNLPASLTIIGEEAFYGSAASGIVFQGNPEIIDKKAFSQMPNLAKAYLPESLVYIAQDAFDKDSDLILFGVEGSYASAWARDNSFSFEAIDPELFANRLKIRTYVSLAILLYTIAVWGLFIYKARNNGRKPGEGRSFRPQEMAELHSIHYAFP